ncbi:MAG: S-ribosylhomocysteine lyase [Clostridia bacterium]|nr:S-ribosylhomocysteine lyase [Clostridia bacterium]
MKRITSFSVDHDYIVPGFYVSRRDGDINTYDLRTRRPNCDSYMDNLTMHSVEHMLATFLRNSEYADKVIYFGPMGCQTGFYLLMRDTSDSEAYALTKKVLRQTIDHNGEMFGAERKECGNYKNLDLASAKAECSAYLAALEKREEMKGEDFSYDKN